VRTDVIAKQCSNAACSPAKQKARDVCHGPKLSVVYAVG
jgi:hypothetical protein